MYLGTSRSQSRTRKNLHDAGFRKHLLGSAVTLDSFRSIKNCSLAEGAAGRTAPVDVDQVNFVRGREGQSQGRQGQAVQGQQQHKN